MHTKIQTLLGRMLVLAALLGAASVFAQWHWVDAQGRKVFSDQPPGLDVPEKNILKRPADPPAKPPPVEGDPNSPPNPNALNSEGRAVGGAGAPRVTASSPRNASDEKAAASDAAKNKGKQDQAKAIEDNLRLQNCALAKRQMAGLKSGGRIARFNDKGEREFLDDAARLTEIQKIQKIIDGDCR